MNRQDIFDRNRNLQMEQEQVNELNEVVRRQEMAINQLHQQLQQRQAQQQMEELEQQILLTPKDILAQFRHLKPLDKDHSVTGFTASVEAILDLCPGNNQQLIRLSMAIVMNEKILGPTGNYIREIGPDANWQQIKTKLMDYHRPKSTYGDIFNKCRNVKVSSLRELFNYFEKAKYELSQIYLFDEIKPQIYEPSRVDKDLVNVLIEKIDIPLRSHIDQNSTLNEVITRYTQIRALDDPRVIHYRHKQKNTQSQNQPFIKPTNQPHQTNTNQHKTQNSQRPYQNHINTNQNNTNQQRNNTQNNNTSGQHRNNYTNRQSSGQTRNSHMSVETQYTNRDNEPTFMELDTIQEERVETENELNFLTLPQGHNYP